MKKQDKEYLTNKQNDFDFDYVESHSEMDESVGMHAGAVKVNIE